MSDTNDAPKMENEAQDRTFKYKAAAFMAGVTGLSLLGGFGMTLTWAKKQDPEMFTKGITTVAKGAERPVLESGGSLALRALGRGTLYSVTGFTIFCYGVWKLMDVNSMSEFRSKVGGVLPSVPRNNPPQSRTEFAGVRDLLQYLIDEDKKTAASAFSDAATKTEAPLQR